MYYTISLEEPFNGEFKEEMFPVIFAKGRLVRINLKGMSFKDADPDALFTHVVRYVMEVFPGPVRRAVDDRLFSWLSYRGVDGPAEWIAKKRLWVSLPSNCREAVVRIYNLCNVCGLPITELKFICEVPPDDSEEEGENASAPNEIAAPQEESLKAAEQLAMATRRKVVELGRQMLERFGFFVISAFEKRLAPELDEYLSGGYTRSAIEIILSSGIEDMVFSGEGEQRMVRMGDVPRAYGEDSLAALFRDRLSGPARWMPLSDLVDGIPEITAAWAVLFVEDVIPDAIPIIEDGVFGYKLLGRFSWPAGFDSFIRRCEFKTWHDVSEAIEEWYGEGFLEDYRVTRETFKMVLGYYAYIGAVMAPVEWWRRIRPSDVALEQSSSTGRPKKSALPIDFNLVPLAADSEQAAPECPNRKPYGMRPDESQLEFVNSQARFIRLLAPAGSGKTTTLLFRCLKLLRDDPSGRILLLTFTRVAAEELRQRMHRHSEFQPLCGHVDITTLNAYGYRIVRHAFPQSRLVETSSRWKVFALEKYLKDVLAASEVYGAYADDSRWMREHSSSLMGFFDTLKTLAVDHEEVVGEDDLWERLKWLAEAGRGPAKLFEDSVRDLAEAEWLTSDIYSRQLAELVRKVMPLYAPSAETMKDDKAMSFEDQKYWAWKVLKIPGMRMERNGYAHIMVDEFQDVNPIDLELVKSLRDLNGSSLTIVGDDDQTIFEWRGATPKYIVSPERFFSAGFTPYLLNVNYRSPRNIVLHSQSLIRHNRERVRKDSKAASSESANIVCRSCQDYDLILNEILADVDNPNYASVAVITRKRSHLIPYQILLASQDREFFAAEDINVLLSDAFKRVITTLEIHGQHDFTENSAIELLNGVRTFRLGKEKSEIVSDILSENGYQTLREFAQGLMAGDFADAFENGKSYGRKILNFLGARTVSDALDCLGQEFLGFKKEFAKAQDDVFFTDPPFDELGEFASRYGCDYGSFVSDLRKAIDTLGDIINGNSIGGEKAIRRGLSTKLHLMTGLRTKGKEFDSVYILRADNDVWPNSQAFDAGFSEGERRLFYVAMTRARKKLAFMHTTPTSYLSEAGIQ